MQFGLAGLHLDLTTPAHTPAKARPHSVGQPKGGAAEFMAKLSRRFSSGCHVREPAIDELPASAVRASA